jgi:hypothetical protein
MRYLVLCYWGRYEDQEMACVPLVLNTKQHLTPVDVIQSLIEMFWKAYQKFNAPQRICPKKDCKNINQPTSGKFCSECGTILLPINLTQYDDEFQEFVYRFFRSTCNEIDCELEEAANETEWELWPKAYHPDAIVTLVGLGDYFEDKEQWQKNKFGTIELLR